MKFVCSCMSYYHDMHTCHHNLDLEKRNKEPYSSPCPQESVQTTTPTASTGAPTATAPVTPPTWQSTASRVVICADVIVTSWYNNVKWWRHGEEFTMATRIQTHIWIVLSNVLMLLDKINMILFETLRVLKHKLYGVKGVVRHVTHMFKSSHDTQNLSLVQTWLVSHR